MVKEGIANGLKLLLFNRGELAVTGKSMVWGCSNKGELVRGRVDFQYVVSALEDAVDAPIGRVDEASLVFVLAIAETSKCANAVFLRWC